MAKDLAVVLNSGSIASAVVTALAAQRFRLVMLHAETAPQSRYRAAYDQQVQHFKPYREHAIAVPWMATVSGGHGLANIEGADIRTYSQRLLEMTPLLAIAARFAAFHGAGAIYTGLRVGSDADDLSLATEYLQIWNEMIQIPCAQPDMEITAPLSELESWQVIDLATQVSVPLERTWSCQSETPEACWTCRGCRAREEAFQQAGKSDPLRAPRR